MTNHAGSDPTEAQEPNQNETKSGQGFCFTEAQVEAAAKAMHETRNPWFAAYGAWGAAGFEIKRAFRESARAALVAAHGAAPQAECDCGAGPGSAVCKKVCATRAPVLPSSGADEAALAEVIARVTDLWDDPLDEVHDIPQIARAVAEWLHSNATKSA